MLRFDGTPFNRQTEEEKWAPAEALEKQLLREKTVFETVRDQEELYQCSLGRWREEDIARENEERTRYLLEMRQRLAPCKNLRS